MAQLAHTHVDARWKGGETIFATEEQSRAEPTYDTSPSTLEAKCCYKCYCNIAPRTRVQEQEGGFEHSVDRRTERRMGSQRWKSARWVAVPWFCTFAECADHCVRAWISIWHFISLLSFKSSNVRRIFMLPTGVICHSCFLKYATLLSLDTTDNNNSK